MPPLPTAIFSALLVLPVLPAGDPTAVATFTIAGRESPPPRGRDPFVFRLILDDKPRMWVAALSPSLFVAYDPATCGLERAFGGGVEFRGKVYDFSQRCSRAKDPIWFSAPSELFAIDDCRALPPGADSTGIELGDALRFSGDGAALVTPPIDLADFTNVMLSFEEKSRKGPFRVEVLDEKVPAAPRQWFHSTLHRDDDGAWQENLKRIAVAASDRSSSIRIRFVQEQGAYDKSLRAVKVKGAYRCWSAKRGEDALPVSPSWGGYVRSGVNGDGRVTLRYRLSIGTGAAVDVEESPEQLPSEGQRVGLERRFRFRGIPEGTRLVLSLAGVAIAPTVRVSGNAELRSVAGVDSIEIASDGEVVVEQLWGGS